MRMELSCFTRRSCRAAALGVGLLATACASGPENTPASALSSPEDGTVDSQELNLPSDPVAESFVDALVQLPGYNPLETTLAFDREALDGDRFLVALEAAVVARGYGARRLTRPGSADTVTHVATLDSNNENGVIRTLGFGAAQMRRSFVRHEDGSWSPTGSLFIRGVDSSGVRLGADVAPRLVPVPAPVPAVPEPLERRQTLANNRRVVPPRPATVPATAPTQDRLQVATLAQSTEQVAPAPAVDSKNVAELGSSNYAGVFKGYGDVAEVILVFPNDSMVLGAGNKRKIRNAIDASNDDEHLFSILGCSFGPTALENGNEVLAIGRAERVREELLFAGVPAERVLDEGCWAGAHADDYPARGVVLTIKRARG